MTGAMATDPILLDEKRQALERVLASRTFSRSEQLRGFLRYVCEAEFEGRAQQINEYALGVAVLGRSASYSPSEDSSVRTRAYELRNKLRSYYGSEASDDPIQIQIEKGAYVPRFSRRATTAEPLVTPPLVTPPPPLAPPELEARGSVPALPAPLSPPAVAFHESRLARALGAVLALAIASSGWLAFALARSRPAPPAHGLRAQPVTREMEALWQPFLDDSVPLIVSFDARLFFFSPATGLVVRDYQTNRPAEAASSEPLRAFQERMDASELQERFDYSDFGAVHGAFLLGRLLGRDVGLKDSNSLGWQDLWNSNVIFLGKPDGNPTIRYALEGKDFVISDHGTAIRNVHPLPGEPDLYRMAVTHGAGEKYALITVTPGPQAGRHMMILCGSGAELLWALAEAVTSPPWVQEIVTHLALPSGECPPAFQVVISATFEANVPVKIRYVAHRVTKLS
jgi:hypothetical protein